LVDSESEVGLAVLELWLTQAGTLAVLGAGLKLFIVYITKSIKNHGNNSGKIGWALLLKYLRYF
jgi:hypothetical protein